MGGYQLNLHGPLPSDGTHGSDGSSRRSSTGSSRSVRGGKQKGHHRDFFQSKRVQSTLSPPRRSTACCDGLSEQRDVIERRLSTIVPLQDFHCMGHSFRSEDNESLALWEEAEHPASNDREWVKIRRPSPRWLEAMRKFDTTKFAPWRSSPVHPKASSDAQRLSLSGTKDIMNSLHESAKAPWYYSNGTAKMRKGESRSVRSPLGACTLSEFIPWSGNLLIPPPKSGEFNRSEGSKSGNSSKQRDTQFVTEVETLKGSSFGNMSSKLEHAEKECLANGVRSGIPQEDSNIIQTEEGSNTANYALQLESTTTKHTEAVTDSKSTSRNSSAKAMDSSVLSDKTSSVQEKQGESSATEVTTFKAPHSCSSSAIPTAEQGGDTLLSEALRKQYILKAESEPLDGNLYVIQPTASQEQSVTNKDDEEAGMSVQSCLRNSNDADEGDHSSQVEASSTPDRLFVSLQTKVFRSPRPDSGMKKTLGDFLESSSPQSILCGLADEGSLPSSNPSLRSDPGMSVTSSALPTSASSESYSSSDTSFDLHATPNSELLGCEDNGELCSSTTELLTATFPTQELSSQADSACAPTELESAFPPSNTPPAKRLSCVPPSGLEDPQMSSVVVPTSRPRHNGSTARLGGMISPLQLTSKCEGGVSNSNYHNCFVASRTLSFSLHDDNLGNRSPTHESTLELLTLECNERKSKSEWQFSNRRHSSADSSDAPTMMISINKAMKKILSKCTAKRSNSKGKSKMESPVLDTLLPASFHSSEAK